MRSIARARLWAFATTSFMYNVGYRSKDTVIPKSLVEAWTGRLLPLILRQVLVVSLPVFSIQHLSMEIDNCYLRIFIIGKCDITEQCVLSENWSSKQIMVWYKQWQSWNRIPIIFVSYGALSVWSCETSHT